MEHSKNFSNVDCSGLLSVSAPLCAVPGVICTAFVVFSLDSLDLTHSGSCTHGRRDVLMERARIVNSLEHALLPKEKYLVGCLGAAGLIIGVAEWICGGRVWDGMPWRVESFFAWSALISLQLLTLYSLTRRLAALGQNVRWAGLILLLWVGFDVPLIGKHAYTVLPLLYSASQIFFLFDLRKAESNAGSSNTKADSC